jgi:PAS domain S-box-containing protein
VVESVDYFDMSERHGSWRSPHARRDLLVLAAFVVVGITLAVLDTAFGVVDWAGFHDAFHIDAWLMAAFFILVGFGVFGKLRRDEYLREVAEHRQTFAALEASEDKWHQVFESAASGVAIISAKDGRIVAVNPAITKATGYTTDELQAKTIMDLVHPDDKQVAVARIRGMESGEIPSTRSQTRFLHRDGQTRYGLVSSAPLGRDGDYLVTHMTDITDQVHAEQRLRDLMQAKDELIASVSHEIRTPLAAVVGYAQLLNDDIVHLTDAERKEMITTIASEGNDLTDIVEDLLVEARADSGVLTVASVPVDLLAQARQTLEALDRDRKGDRVIVVEPTARATADPARVRQIVRNLISNALRYGGDEIRIVCHDHPDAVGLTVSDNGDGVPPEDRERIFESYQRAHERPGLTSSIGLGLGVSRKLARLMGGDLDYTYDEGWSDFSLTLPPG